ncbi:hypothetical protein P691DRAFT_695568, partial [Macrolepiota fuliginosa MF-IS2]
DCKQDYVAPFNVSEQPTPAPTLVGRSEEDKKPKVEYPDSVSEYRKHSRSKGDNGNVPGAKGRLQKLPKR